MRCVCCMHVVFVVTNKSRVLNTNHYKPRRVLLLACIILELLVRYIPHWGEVYASKVYPTLSAVLSWVASAVPFSLDEWFVVLTVLVMIVYPIRARRKTGWKAITLAELELMGWIYVWFYLGWGMNYYRDPLLLRAGAAPSEVEKDVFCRFLSEYTDSLNATYTPTDSISKETIHSDVKSLYADVPERYGLARPRTYQEPKAVSFNWIYSAVGVLGYMGPFAAESQLNRELPAVQYTFTYAHELAHLLSVSSEAEANYWAYTVCRKSADRATRYSAYFGILPNVMHNASSILSPQEYAQWTATIDSHIITQRQQISAYWQSQFNPQLLSLQKTMFEALLKGNRIPTGRQNYDQVLNLIISLEYNSK